MSVHLWSNLHFVFCASVRSLLHIDLDMSKDKLKEQSTSYSTPPEMHKQTVDTSLEGPRIFMHGIGGGEGRGRSRPTQGASVLLFFRSYGIICCFLRKWVGAAITMFVSLYATFGLGHNICVN